MGRQYSKLEKICRFKKEGKYTYVKLAFNINKIEQEIEI